MAVALHLARVDGGGVRAGHEQGAGQLCLGQPQAQIGVGSVAGTVMQGPVGISRARGPGWSPPVKSRLMVTMVSAALGPLRRTAVLEEEIQRHLYHGLDTAGALHPGRGDPVAQLLGGGAVLPNRAPRATFSLRQRCPISNYNHSARQGCVLNRADSIHRLEHPHHHLPPGIVSPP